MLENANQAGLLVTLTSDIVAVHVANNSIGLSDVATLFTNVHNALAGLSKPLAEAVANQKPAGSIRASVKPDFIFCLVDGKTRNMLKRQLSIDPTKIIETGGAFPPTIR